MLSREMTTNRITWLVLAASLACGGTNSWGATLVLGEGATTNLVVNVPTGSVMIVRASSLRDAANKITLNNPDGTFQPGMDAGFDTRFQPRYLAGPCTFIYSPQYEEMQTSIFNYEVVPAAGIQTLIATNSAIIHLPAGKRLRLLDGSYPLWFDVSLTNGASAKFGVSPKPDPMTGGTQCNTEGFELAGPLTIAVSGDSFGQKSCYLTYFFAADVAEVVGQSIQSPAGSVVAIEKSADLQTWYPAFITSEKSSPKAFYRLSVGR